MVDAFKWLENNESSIRKRLLSFMPEYCKQSRKAMEIIDSVYDGGKKE